MRPSLVQRRIQPTLLELAGSFPVVTVAGPRQAGKTTLCRMAFPDLRYVSLEDPGERRYALDDPRGFLGELTEGAVIDEVLNGVPGTFLIWSSWQRHDRPW
jgi:hypothetical protein